MSSAKGVCPTPIAPHSFSEARQMSSSVVFAGSVAVMGLPFGQSQSLGTWSIKTKLITVVLWLRRLRCLPCQLQFQLQLLNLFLKFGFPCEANNRRHLLPRCLHSLRRMVMPPHRPQSGFLISISRHSTYNLLQLPNPLRPYRGSNNLRPLNNPLPSLRMVEHLRVLHRSLVVGGGGIRRVVIEHPLSLHHIEDGEPRPPCISHHFFPF